MFEDIYINEKGDIATPCKFISKEEALKMWPDTNSDMIWIDVETAMPNDSEYVLIKCDGFIGISRLIDGEWDTGNFERRPMFDRHNRIMSKIDAQQWMPLPE